VKVYDSFWFPMKTPLLTEVLTTLLDAWSVCLVPLTGCRANLQYHANIRVAINTYCLGVKSSDDDVGYLVYWYAMQILVFNTKPETKTER
jgi:hypothetical protein